MEQKVETRQSEVIFSTSEPAEMINKYLARNLLRTWTESFVDEDSGEAIDIERHEVLLQKGELIDRDILARISFYLQSGDIKEVEVSNQSRKADYKESGNYPHLVVAKIGSKKFKFLLYALSVEKAILIVKDFIELNYSSVFCITSAKEYNSAIMLKDNFTSLAETEDVSDAEFKKNLDKVDYKFYELGVVIAYGEANDANNVEYTFIVYTKDVDKALSVISNYIAIKLKDSDNSELDFNIKLETSKILTIANVIDAEISDAYKEI